MRNETQVVAELTEAVRAEGNPRLFLAPVSPLPAGVLVPRAWQQLLMDQNAHKQTTNLLWHRGAQVLPQLVASIHDRLQSVGLMVTDGKPPSLVYVFTKNGEAFARRGYPATASLPALSKQLSVDMSIIYAIHDGWVNLFSADTGPLPTEEWEILGKSQPDAQDGFLKVFSTGGNAMGFDLSEHPAGSYIIWSEGEVERVDDFWGRLDSWLSRGLQKMDPSTP